MDEGLIIDVVGLIPLLGHFRAECGRYVVRVEDHLTCTEKTSYREILIDLIQFIFEYDVNYSFEHKVIYTKRCRISCEFI